MQPVLPSSYSMPSYGRYFIQKDNVKRSDIFSLQEEVLTQDDIWLQPITNELGTLALPLVNAIGNRLNNFEYSDIEMHAVLDMYPGAKWCNLVIPHAKWHLETGIALTDFTFLTDELYRFLSSSQ